jgi:hypothetical protein
MSKVNASMPLYRQDLATLYPTAMEYDRVKESKILGQDQMKSAKSAKYRKERYTRMGRLRYEKY